MKSPYGLFIAWQTLWRTLIRRYRRKTPASCRTPIDSITIINAAANKRYTVVPSEFDFESVTAHTPFLF